MTVSVRVLVLFCAMFADIQISQDPKTLHCNTFVFFLIPFLKNLIVLFVNILQKQAIKK